MFYFLRKEDFVPFKIADIMEKYIDFKYVVSYFGVLSLDLGMQSLLHRTLPLC